MTRRTPEPPSPATSSSRCPPLLARCSTGRSRCQFRVQQAVMRSSRAGPDRRTPQPPCPDSPGICRADHTCCTDAAKPSAGSATTHLSVGNFLYRAPATPITTFSHLQPPIQDRVSRREKDPRGENGRDGFLLTRASPGRCLETPLDSSRRSTTASCLRRRAWRAGLDNRATDSAYQQTRSHAAGQVSASEVAERDHRQAQVAAPPHDVGDTETERRWKVAPPPPCRSLLLWTFRVKKVARTTHIDPLLTLWDGRVQPDQHLSASRPAASSLAILLAKWVDPPLSSGLLCVSMSNLFGNRPRLMKRGRERGIPLLRAGKPQVRSADLGPCSRPRLLVRSGAVGLNERLEERDNHYSQVRNTQPITWPP